ncbi:MAG: DUF6391 domain-containing protein [Anaerolineales bacterium]|jgi:hypothetical protein
MTGTQSSLADINNWRDIPPIARVRRNHALEHATINLLSRRFPQTSIVGRSDTGGFYLVGNLPTDAVEEIAQEALERLRSGEHHLAIHQNCGTNIVTSGLLAGLASFAALAGSKSWRDRLDRLPLALTGSLLALLISQPLGTKAQQHLTTDANVGELQIDQIIRKQRGGTIVHRVLTTT